MLLLFQRCDRDLRLDLVGLGVGVGGRKGGRIGGGVLLGSSLLLTLVRSGEGAMAWKIMEAIHRAMVIWLIDG